jgi:hypothetical protein
MGVFVRLALCWILVEELGYGLRPRSSLLLQRYTTRVVKLTLLSGEHQRISAVGQEKQQCFTCWYMYGACLRTFQGRKASLTSRFKFASREEEKGVLCFALAE